MVASLHPIHQRTSESENIWFGFCFALSARKLRLELVAGFLSRVQTLVVDVDTADGRDTGREAVGRAAQNATGGQAGRINRNAPGD